MKRHVFILGLAGGMVATLLQWTKYRFLVAEHSVEIYGALVGAIFAGFGIWLGFGLAGRRKNIVIKEIPVPVQIAPAGAFAPDERTRDDLGITPRELEVLGLVAEGLSNREIAAKLYVSENTVKTHCSRTFDKLGARRRTEAVQLGKGLGLLP